MSRSRNFTEAQTKIINLYENGKNVPNFGLRGASGILPVGGFVQQRGVLVRQQIQTYYTRETLAVICGYRDEAVALTEVAMRNSHIVSKKTTADLKNGNLTRFDREVLKGLRNYWEEDGIEGHACYYYAVPLYNVVNDPKNGYAKIVCEPKQPLVLVPKTCDSAMHKFGIKNDEFLKELAICACWIVSHQLVMRRQVWSEKAANELIRGWRPLIEATKLWPFFDNFVKTKIAELNPGH